MKKFIYEKSCSLKVSNFTKNEFFHRYLQGFDQKFWTSIFEEQISLATSVLRKLHRENDQSIPAGVYLLKVKYIKH